MNRSVVRKNGIPLYVQVKERLLGDIRNGTYRAGDKIPTERELAERLRVSRNTVSQAYQELESEGIITSLQGRGTFVCDQDDTVRFGNRRGLLRKIVDVALEEAIQLGFSLDDFLDIATARAREKVASLHTARVAFIECNREQIEHFSRKLEYGGVHITPVLLDDLRDLQKNDLQYVESADLVVTTLFHYDEVQELLGFRREILAIALDPELETVVKIARIPPSKRVGLICRSDNFAGKVLYSLKQAGLDELDIQSTIVTEPTAIADFVSVIDVAIVSPSRRREVETQCKKRQEIVEFVFTPDNASVNLLRAALAELRRG